MSGPPPYPPLDKSTNLADLTIHYRVWGHSDTPIVLLHGLASTSHIWNLVSPILSQDYTLFALDQRGHGNSGKPDHGYGFSSVVSDLKSFIDFLALHKPLLIGHSWGAHVALEFAAAHKQYIRGICLVDGGLLELSAIPGLTLEKAKEELAPPDFTGLTLKQMSGRISQFRTWITPDILTIILNNFEVLDDSTIRARLTKDNHLQIIKALWEHKPSEIFPEVQSPVLILPTRQRNKSSHTHRGLTRDEAITTATHLLPRSQTVWLEDTVHDVPLQRPNLLARIIAQYLADGFFD